MKSRSITFERDINKSYMKVSAISKENFDEKMMLKKQFSGLLPMEKGFVDGEGQYWYLISGKQSLADFCDIHEISKSLYENLLLRICNQLEVLEWNLIDTNCLVLWPEYIFLNSTGEEISFVLYPDNKESIHAQLQSLLENILEKINHNDEWLVKNAYDIYEMVLSESYSVTEIKSRIMEGQELHMDAKELVKEVPAQERSEPDDVVQEENKRKSLLTNQKLIELFDRVKKVLLMEPKDLLAFKANEKEDIPEVVYPEDVVFVEEKTSQHPTVCLSTIKRVSEGILAYEGRGNREDLYLEKSLCIIGKSEAANLQIQKDTISNYHAKISYGENEYYIEDLNSTNGTFVNEELLNYKEARRLCPGDCIQFADVKYRFL